MAKTRDDVISMDMAEEDKMALQGMNDLVQLAYSADYGTDVPCDVLARGIFGVSAK